MWLGPSNCLTALGSTKELQTLGSTYSVSLTLSTVIFPHHMRVHYRSSEISSKRAYIAASLLCTDWVGSEVSQHGVKVTTGTELWPKETFRSSPAALSLNWRYYQTRVDTDTLQPAQATPPSRARNESLGIGLIGVTDRCRFWLLIGMLQSMLC